jgi:adenine-specific DNA-methyltransferase
MPAAEPYHPRRHAAAWTDDYVFHQLIPYIGNKRKLLGLIGQAVASTQPAPGAAIADLFAGSGVVARHLKGIGHRVIANDWEPYTRPINTCAVACDAPPAFAALGGYAAAIAALNALPPREDWVTRTLCPANDAAPDPTVERLFFMRKNGLRIDAIRHQIAQWRAAGQVDGIEEACLLAPLLYQACYASNTSGVFKGFHHGWGGQTGTALYRIAGDLALSPARFHRAAGPCLVWQRDALEAARALAADPPHAVYLDPPYNQHPYASNYHVLNSIALWDKPDTPPAHTPGAKAAIRTDWRAARRSPYNHRTQATAAYAELLGAIPSRWVLTSYSTEGIIPLRELLDINAARGGLRLFLRPYKRYRVSSQRYSAKPRNIEFVLVLDTQAPRHRDVAGLMGRLEAAEQALSPASS